jgi:hypothetical protein
MGVRAVNRVRRVSWARTKLGWTVHENWRNIIFSDEMSLIVSGSGLFKVWRKRTEGFLPECIGYLKQHDGRNLKVMVWGMFKSGDWAGHDSIGISLVSFHNCVWRDAWGGALSS